MEALIIYGPSGSGKSTLAESVLDGAEYAVRIERDVIRAEVIPGFHENGWNGYKPFSPWEDVVTFYWHSEIYRAQELCRNIIISDTLCKKKERDKVKFLLETLGYEVEFFRMDTSLETCIKRDALRDNRSVGETVILQQFENLNKG
ncbi:MAG: AAA family ATPase [Gammaproteobacteria bacterium]|nr:AAA family ATPase [Gammaproteobacteria bacterium]